MPDPPRLVLRLLCGSALLYKYVYEENKGCCCCCCLTFIFLGLTNKVLKLTIAGKHGLYTPFLSHPTDVAVLFYFVQAWCVLYDSGRHPCALIIMCSIKDLQLSENNSRPRKFGTFWQIKVGRATLWQTFWVDYLAGHQGGTQLQPLEGLPTFFRQLVRKKKLFWSKNGVSCTFGENGAAKQIVSCVSNLVRETLGGAYKNTKILYTIPTNSKKFGQILNLIETVEAKTNNRARRKWRALILGKEVLGYFVAKIDISATVLSNAGKVEARGDAIFQTDFTKDFSETLDRKALVDYLQTSGFAFQGCRDGKAQGTISTNAKDVDGQVCTWMQTSHRGYATRVKLYNKIISFFLTLRSSVWSVQRGDRDWFPSIGYLRTHTTFTWYILVCTGNSNFLEY